MVVPHTGIAHLAVLVAPVGVVVVAAHQVVHLLGRGVLRSALYGRAEKSQREAVLVVQPLLSRQEICKGIVVHACDIVVAAQTRRHRGRKRPAVVHQAGGVRGHQAQTVGGAVGQHTEAVTLRHRRSIRVDIGKSVDTAHAIIGKCHSSYSLLLSGSLIQTAEQRIRSIAAKSVVELYAVDIDIGHTALIASVEKAHLAEAE